jgi:hypothetical protein
MEKLINHHYGLLTSDQNYIIPMDIEMEIEDYSGIVRDYCTDTDKYLESQKEWLEFIMDNNYHK